IENGLQPDLLLGSKYGHQMHVWDLRRRRHLQALDLGKEQQMVLEMRPAHNPTKAYGFVSVVVSIKDLSASIWLWHRDNGAWDIKKVIEIPAEPADPEKLDRKSTRLNSSHDQISYAVFCLKKKKTI